MPLRTYHKGPDECTQAFEGMHIGQPVSNALINTSPVATDQWALTEMSPPMMSAFGAMSTASAFPPQLSSDWGRGYEASSTTDGDSAAEL